MWRKSTIIAAVLSILLISRHDVMGSQLGTLDISSTPSGASIVLDSTARGTTPQIINDFPAGDHELKLTLNNYFDYVTWFYLGTGKTRIFSITLSFSIIGDLQKPPEISFEGIQLGAASIRGKANNIDANKIRVVLWALTNNWYVQPCIDEPYTTIRGDGSWENGTHSWQRMVALLVDSSYVPGSIRYTHPALDPSVIGWTEYPQVRPDMPIRFSDYSWGVKLAEDRFDPGPNYFSAGTDNIWVDANGMHLKIFYQNGKWTCPEVYLLQSLGLV